MDYSKYEHLLIDVKDRIALVTINRPDKLNATNARLHWELSKIWLDLAEDEDVRVIVITGAGRAFSAGGDFKVLEEGMGNADVVVQLFKEDRDIVHNMINIDKPIISAINGHAVGAGCAVALMADISIAGESARIIDGHIILGVVAGDHAALIWPLQVGMAKAKLYLLTGEALDGTEAERIGLISKVVPDEELMPTAMAYADKLAKGPAQAIQWTKQALNQWLRQAAITSYDYSAALEMLGFMGPDVREGLAALKEKRPANFR